jgi:hypothetical protein
LPHDIITLFNHVPIAKVTLKIALIVSKELACIAARDIELDKIGTNYLQKGKAVPLQSWSGPEGSRKLRFPDYMTTAQDGGKVVSLTHRSPLPPGNAPGTNFVRGRVDPKVIVRSEGLYQ